MYNAVERAKQLSPHELQAIVGVNVGERFSYDYSKLILQQQIQHQQLMNAAAASGCMVGPPGLPPGMSMGSHPAISSASMPGMSGANLAAAGMLSMGNSLGQIPPAAFLTPLPPGIKMEEKVGSASSVTSVNSEERVKLWLA